MFAANGGPRIAFALMASRAGITNRVDHARHGRRHSRLTILSAVLSPSGVAEDTWSGERFQVGHDRGFPRARRCGQKEVLDQFTVGTSCSLTKTSGALFARAVPVYVSGRGTDVEIPTKPSFAALPNSYHLHASGRQSVKRAPTLTCPLRSKKGGGGCSS